LVFGLQGIRPPVAAEVGQILRRPEIEKLLDRKGPGVDLVEQLIPGFVSALGVLKACIE
jgi:hypothetical protein